MPITLNINVTKIDKQYLFDGKSGKYLDLVLFENKDGHDAYGNTGYVVQGISKESREAGQRGPIVGNWKADKKSPPKQATTQPASQPFDDGDSIPF